MRVFVDGDGCPDLDDIIHICYLYNVDVVVYIDYAHSILKEHCKIVVCDIGNDSVDMRIINDIHKNDILITQDYGLASHALVKGVKVLHVSGQIINNDNIDMFLFSRFLSAKERKKNNRVKGPSPRTQEVREKFLKILEFLLKEESLK